MQIAIILHSVCGNTYLLAKTFAAAFSERGHTVLLRRVADTDWTLKPDTSEAATTELTAMRTLPEADPQDLLCADVILMGSPVYFGNVSAEMKAFMDATG